MTTRRRTAPTLPANHVWCPECAGEGFHEVESGIHRYGRGLGDCEPSYTTKTCELCDGGRVVPESFLANDEDDAPTGPGLRKSEPPPAAVVVRVAS
jgi:hypothetical protein